MTRSSLGERLIRALATARTPSEGTDALLQEAGRATGARLAVLWVFDDRVQALRWGGDWSAEPRADSFRVACRRLTFPPGVGIVGAVFERDAPAWTEVDDLPRGEPAIAAGLRSVVGVPLAGAEGSLGVLELFAATADEPEPAVLEDLRLIAGQLTGYLGRLRVEERLQAIEERSTTIVDAALDCIVTMDHRGRIVDFNPMAEATFGYTREDAAGQVLADLIIPPEFRAAHHRALATYLGTGEPTILNQRLELTGMRADGSTFPVELTVTRLGTREPPVFAGFVRDVTASHEADRERERLLAQTITSRAVAEAAQARLETAHAATKAAQRRLTLLARAGERLIAGGDGYERTLQEVAELAVPAVADWCSLTLNGGHGLVRRIAAAPVGAPEPAPDGESVLTVPLRTPRRAFGQLTLAMGDSGRRFEDDDRAMAYSLAARCALAVENARLFTERSHIADTLQRSLLPARLPQVPGLDVAARYRAAGEHNVVGGDFYDFFRSGDGVWTAILGDVAGKGAEAAALTALTRHTLRAGALRESSPMANLRLLNEALLAAGEDATGARFATVIYTRIRRRDGRVVVTVSTGGHLPPVLLRADGTLEYVPIRGTLLGALEAIDLHEIDVDLAPGDLMLLYTDGVTEARPREPGFGEHLLEQVLRDHLGASAAEVVDALERDVVGAQEGEPRDDIALIAVRAAV